ncbi:FUSC family protein [Aurantimonas sp. VKM B-3413]|uniref:FUSC family protein n=1 Tax=Aurantimonas sp. VKM B-3413 TaxID=2779401 RepID=UPI001E5EA221|nr:FUSC family protein [Aurantimonas sp. VKM B-3413]MCB8838944.1 FUSC family protein [Aurantimonas sp. VKM B-3413]
MLSRITPFAFMASSDPGLSRLRMALRGTLTLVAVAASLAALHFVTTLSIAAYGLGIVTAFIGSLAIRDIGARARAVSRLYSGLASFAAVAMVSVIAHPRIVDGLFLVIIFLAVFIRRFGPRWNAVGMATFMATFLSAYLHAGVGDLGGVALAIGVSSAVAHLVRNTVLPERPAWDFAVAVEAVGERLRQLRLALADAHAAGPGDPMRAREIVRLEARLKDMILTAEGYLPAKAADAAGEAARREMAIALFDLHLAAETRFFVGFDETTGQAAPGEIDVADRRIDRTLEAVRRLASALPKSAFAADPGLPRPAAPGTGWMGLFQDPAVRTAIQVTLASAIAMTAGIWLSERRWFWAILTAFLVFTNTQSRGDTAMRGLARALGTLFGIVVGIALATALSGKTGVEIGLIVVFVFSAFYYLQVSYAAMTFFITLVVSLLYGLIGQFTPELLVLRLEETLIGAAAGILVSFAVFSRSTSSVARQAVEDYFDALDDLLEAAERAVAGEPDIKLLRSSRQIDRKADDLAVAARPLGSNWQLVRRPGRVRRTLIRFRGCAHWAHVFADALRAMLVTQESLPADLGSRIAAVRAKVATAKASSSSFFGSEMLTLGRAPSRLPLAADTPEDRSDPRLALAVIAHILDEPLRDRSETAGAAAHPRKEAAAPLDSPQAGG